MRVFVYFCQYNCFLATREVKVKIKVDNFDLGSHSKVEIQISVRSTFLSLRPSHFQKATPLQLSRKSHHASEIRNKNLLCPTPGTLPGLAMAATSLSPPSAQPVRQRRAHPAASQSSGPALCKASRVVPHDAASLPKPRAECASRTLDGKREHWMEKGNDSSALPAYTMRNPNFTLKCRDRIALRCQTFQLFQPCCVPLQICQTPS